MFGFKSAAYIALYDFALMCFSLDVRLAHGELVGGLDSDSRNLL